MNTYSITRRALISTVACSGLISAGFARAATSVTPEGQASGAMGLVSVFKLGSITLHSYMAPGSSAAVTTQIIETPNELHIIDAQFVQALAKEVRSYADTLGKPIAGLYLSHWHPDHVLGAAQFSNLPFTTSQDIHSDCEKFRETYVKRKAQFGDDTPLILPEGSLTPGEQDWDGQQVVIRQVDDCESEHALTFHFPDAGLVIAQDLMFNNAHAFPLGNHTNWISVLAELREIQGLRVIGCGHGLPATAGAVSDSIAYLEFQRSVFGSEQDAEAAIAALQKQFPKFEGQSVLRFVSGVYK